MAVCQSSGRAGWSIAAAIALALLNSPASGQQIWAYPEKGQSQQQQERDRSECTNWATQQTGYDARQQPVPQTNAPPSRGGAVVGGAARGAAVGAVGGAIGGDAGKGAAIGAATGGMFGAMRRNQEVRRQNQSQQQQNAANAAQADAFNRAMGVCLRGRGYSVG